MFYLDIKPYVGVEHDDVTVANRLDGYSCRTAKSLKGTVGFEIPFEEVDMVADCKELVGYIMESRQLSKRNLVFMSKAVSSQSPLLFTKPNVLLSSLLVKM